MDTGWMMYSPLTGKHNCLKMYSSSHFFSTEPEEDLDDVPITLKDAMEQLGLDEHRAVLEKEQIDLDSLVGIN